MNPIIKELKSEYPSIDIKKIDVDDPKNYDIADKYQVKSIPYIVFEQDGTILEKIIGSVPKNKLVDIIQKYSE